MRVLADVRLGCLHQRATAHFRCSRDDNVQYILDHVLKPAPVVSEEFTPASTRREVVDHDVGFWSHWASRGKFSYGVDQEQF